jgi:DMSO/TMAO reductase YedYZ molybdopterin-dependent catalytic subunit
MDTSQMSRRELLKRGSAAFTGMALLHAPLLAQAFPSRPGEEVIPWADQPPANPVPHVVANLQPWEELHTWLTPNDKFFSVSHYNKPTLDDKTWRLEITGLVKRPLTLTLSELKARPRREVVFTLECSGNHGFPWFLSGIGNATWAGTPLAPLLQEAGVLEPGIEVVFIGSDVGEEEVRSIKMQQNFARSMSLQDAMHPHNLLCYEMNGAPLPHTWCNVFPLGVQTPNSL